MFKKRKVNILNNYVENITPLTEKQKEIVDLKNRIAQWKEKAKKIQSSFDFLLPNYIIDEIIEKGNSIKQNYQNLYCLINCAVINGRITKENGITLRQYAKKLCK